VEVSLRVKNGDFLFYSPDRVRFIGNERDYRLFSGFIIPQFAPTGIKVAVVVGTILLTINHGYAMVAILITGV
jgi:galactokinase